MASTSSSVSTRTSAGVWLVGKSVACMSHARLPSNHDVLKTLNFHHIEEKQTVRQSVKNTVISVLEIWEKARIPTQRIDAAERKLNKLFETYNRLKKNRKTKLESCRIKENLFKSNLLKLFDIAAKDALKLMKNEEDKKFLIMQREDNMSCSMAGVDMNLSQRESRKRKRQTEMNVRKLKSKANSSLHSHARKESMLQATNSSPSSIESLRLDNDYQVPSPPKSHTSKTASKNIPQLLNKDVVATLDRVNVSDRQAMFLVGSVAQALGTNVEDISLSRSTIRRKRNEIRKSIVESDKSSFSPLNPLVMHWDGKLLPNIVGGVEKVDRIAVIVTGGEIEKLLAVPAVKKGTGQEQATACLQTLDDWQLKSQVRGL